MALWDVFTRSSSQTQHKNKHVFTDEERQLALEYRKMNQEANNRNKLLEKQNEALQLKLEQMAFVKQLNGFSAGGEEKDATDDMFGSFMQMLMASKMGGQLQQGQAPAPAQQEAQNGGISFTDEEIGQLIDQFPKSHLKMAKNYSDELIAKTILAKFPNISEESLIRAVELIRER